MRRLLRPGTRVLFLGRRLLLRVAGRAIYMAISDSKERQYLRRGASTVFA